MDDREKHIPYFTETDIPPVFYDSLTGEPFAHCKVCDKSLLEGARYMIEKAIIPGDVKFEYAICLECAEKMRENMSKESLRKLEEFMSRQNDWAERPHKLWRSGKRRPEDWLEQCAVSGDGVEELKEYQLFGMFSGNKLLLGSMPYMLSMGAIEQMNGLLSKQTRGEMDDFIDEFLGLPPEWKALIEDRDLILV